MAQIIDTKGLVNNRLLAWIKRIQKEQDAVTKDYTRRLLDYYQNKTLKNVNDKIRLVELVIENDPEITQAAIKKTHEYIGLMALVVSELKDFVNYSTIQIDLASTQSVKDAIVDIGLLANVINLDKAKIVTPSAVEILRNYLAEDGELYKRIGLWAGQSTDAVINAILDGVGLGQNPKKIAGLIYKALGLSLQDAVRTTRTVQLWSYREATRANYIANSDIIKGWIWYATLDDRVCMSCVNMHGTLHSLTEPLNDHYNGRCTMLPYPQSEQIIQQTGQEWFDSLSEEQKEASMGKGRYQAYKDGLFSFDQLSRELSDPVYGLMRTETPLKELL